MRNTDERMSAVKERIAAMEKDSRRKSGKVISILSVAACFLLVMALALNMPVWSEKMIVAGNNDTAAASIFAGSSVMGYFVVSILAFLLGMSVTLLCLRLRKWSQDRDR